MAITTDSRSDNSATPLSHIAIIMDGNGRWARNKKKPRTIGHQEGVNTLREIVKECLTLNIKHLSVYAFSTENWKRPKKEVNFLMTLLNKMILKELNLFINQNIKVKIIGSRQNLSEELTKNFQLIETKTNHCSKMQLNLMINYGSRTEILDAFKTALKDPSITQDTINEEKISELLYTKSIPDPELLIRTSGESRISNYMLWQISYSELHFTKTLWPDFTAQELQSIINDYHQRKRRFGGI